MSEGEPHEIVLVTRPVGATAEPSSMETLRQVFSTSFGLASTAAAAVTAVVEDAAGAALDATLGAALDRIVPVVTDAIVDRLDLTEIVLSRVDLNRVVNRALDSLDLTQLVLDRVDINAVVAEADFDSIIDRVPVVPLANYVIEEIDLPQIIRESTGGIATDAINAIRVQGVGADQFVSRLADRLLFRRRQRQVEAPGDPESLMNRMREDFTSQERAQAIVEPGQRT